MSRRAHRAHRGRRRWSVLLLAGIAPLLVSGCGATGITAGPLQVSMSTTFANLYALQQIDQGDPRPAVRSLHAQTSCQKGTPASPQSGAGNDWLCEITYLVAGPATPVIARYNVTIQTDGCYAADGDGPASVNGSRTITGPNYEQLQNPLWLIDGCFDTT